MKKFILTFFLFIFSIIGKSQMCNTTPTSMGALTPTGTWQNVNANSGAKRYWTFNATAGCTYDFSTCNSVNTNDTYLRLYLGTVPTTAVFQTSNDDNGPFCTGNKASLSWTCPTTGAYSILMTNFNCANISSNSILSYRYACLPPFDPCSSIPTITCGTSNIITVSSGNGVYNPPTTSCGFTTPGKEYIYSFTPTVTGNYTLSQPTSFGYIDWFYKPASGGCNGTGWTCIDDITNGNIGNTNVNIPLTSGVTYYIMADPESTTGGTVNFTLNCAILPLSNNNCSGAIVIPSVPYTSPISTNNPSTDDVPTSSSFCGTQGSNVWYKVVGNGNELTATTCNLSTNFDTEVRVYTGSCSSLNSMVEVDCNDDDVVCSFSGVHSTAIWCSDPGVDYYISVGYFISGTGYGNFVLSVTNGAPCSVLPIELLSFNGINKDDHNYLSWVTLTEHNNQYFTLERSINLTQWETIKIQQGAGNSIQTNYYDHYDFNYDGEHVNYYRLSQTDYDGKQEYFNIISIDKQQKLNYCDNVEYYNLLGKIIDIEQVPIGIYLKKCNNKVIKIFKN